jgi:putative ABC transport system substrate-binding protein
VKRREFIAGLGSAAAWPVAAQAQQPGRLRQIGILWPADEHDPVRKLWMAAILQGLSELGWTEGRNLRIDVRWNPRTAEQIRMYAKELVDLQPDVLVTATVRLTQAVQQQTRTIPIVFMGAGDPLSSGLVASLSRPDGNTTGITDIFPSIAGKWLQLLIECVPDLARVALIFNPNISNPTSASALAVAAQTASQHGVITIEMPVRDVAEIERAIPSFATKPGGGLIVFPPPLSAAEREMINSLAVRHRLPVIYQEKSFAIEGGLMSYGADFLDLYRRGGPPYVDHILRGAKPGDLPVQFPTKFTLVVNLKSARAMNLTIPEPFLLRADEVIE